MKAICNEWKTWYGETLEVEVDADMLMEIIDRIDTAIDVAVSEKDYELAAELIDHRIDLNKHLETYWEKKNAERESNENS